MQQFTHHNIGQAIHEGWATLLERIKSEIRQEYKCEPRHFASAIITAPFAREVSDNGKVEIFEIVGQQNAMRVYAWVNKRKAGAQATLVTILGGSTIDSPWRAIHAYWGNQKEISQQTREAR